MVKEKKKRSERGKALGYIQFVPENASSLATTTITEDASPYNAPLTVPLSYMYQALGLVVPPQYPRETAVNSRIFRKAGI